jgi:hypothetical protein
MTLTSSSIHLDNIFERMLELEYVYSLEIEKLMNIINESDRYLEELNENIVF